MPLRWETSPGEGFYSLITCMQVYVLSMRSEGKCWQLQWRRDACETESLPREVGCKVKGCMRDGLWARESKFAWDMSLEGSGALKLV